MKNVYDDPPCPYCDRHNCPGANPVGVCPDQIDDDRDYSESRDRGDFDGPLIDVALSDPAKGN